ncbi:MAG: hypothetical protein HOK35_06085 [Cytophagia bacterium]|nr:hypothetical protein [Bacteroidota bacterium]MBT5528708.1 hypothetical protein [Cytophagia bacterium]
MLNLYLWTAIIWIIILVIGIAMRKKWLGKNFLRLAYILLILILLEGVCLLALKIKSGYWLFNEKYNLNAELFEPHPYLVGVPKKNAELKVNGITYSNNAEGFRGKEFEKAKSKTRIVAVGGSTTYGTSVNDWETWPAYLDSIMGADYEVLNFGISGHSTVEHIIQSSFILPEYKPDVVLVHCGLNDLRSAYIADLACDYSDFHAPNLFGALGFCPLNKLPRLAIIRAGVLILQKVKLYPECTYYQTAVRQDSSLMALERALELYERNLTTLSAILNKQGVELVFVPQLLHKDAIEGNKLKWWIPYVEDDQLLGLIADYNKCMKEVAIKESGAFADEVLDYNWKGADFVDPSHLNADANLRFAEIISHYIKHDRDTIEFANQK